MDNMEILKLNRKVFKIIGVCSVAEESKFVSKCAQLSCAFSIGIPFLTIVLGSGLTLFEHIQNGNFGANAFTLIEVTAPFAIFLSFISLVFQRKSIREFFDQTQRIFDQCNFKIDV